MLAVFLPFVENLMLTQTIAVCTADRGHYSPKMIIGVRLGHAKPSNPSFQPTAYGGG